MWLRWFGSKRWILPSQENGGGIKDVLSSAITFVRHRVAKSTIIVSKLCTPNPSTASPF